MKVGVFTVILQSQPFEQALDYLAGLGVQTVEIGTGAYTGSSHCEPDALLEILRKRRIFSTRLSLEDWRSLVCPFMEIRCIPTKRPPPRITRPLSAVSAWPISSEWIRSPPLAAVREVPLEISNPIGSLVPGRQISCRFSTINGTKSPSHIGKKPPNLRERTVFAKSH